MNLSIELRIFGSAICSGVFLLSTYYLIIVIRNIIHHSQWMINLEDVFYWLLSGKYLFVQIYHTNNGNIRLYYVLGLVLGATLTWKTFQISRKMWNKFVHPEKEKSID